MTVRSFAGTASLTSAMPAKRGVGPVHASVQRRQDSGDGVRRVLRTPPQRTVHQPLADCRILSPTASEATAASRDDTHCTVPFDFETAGGWISSKFNHVTDRLLLSFTGAVF